MNGDPLRERLELLAAIPDCEPAVLALVAALVVVLDLCDKQWHLNAIDIRAAVANVLDVHDEGLGYVAARQNTDMMHELATRMAPLLTALRTRAEDAERRLGEVAALDTPFTRRTGSVPLVMLLAALHGEEE